jgi:deoxyribodipyrimidine photolyase-related protein
VRHHQQKLVLFLAAMRHYADELRGAGFEVCYRQLFDDEDADYETRLASAVRDHQCTRLEHFEIEDRPMEARIKAVAEQLGLPRAELPSPMFLCSRTEFRRFAARGTRLLMADFYRWQRERLGILVDAGRQPAGGRWSFDAQNRRKLPRGVAPPALPAPVHSPHVSDVQWLVGHYFGDHPGEAGDFCWPVTRQSAAHWLHSFVGERLAHFGPYEDAISNRSDALFHSALTPCLNLGLLTPREVVDAALEAAQRRDVPIASLEGFIRQVIGWREFVRGIYREHGPQQESGNFFGHRRQLAPSWYDGTTGIDPLDAAIDRSRRLGWTHHIERLMVIGNLMTLCEIEPRTAWRWFMEMYVDSSEWVMGPNVYGMALFSDGGLFATKPYVCGSNYLRKMSDHPEGPWCDTVDGLYWRFVHRHREYFASNPRLALVPKALDLLPAARRQRIFAAAEKFLAAHTLPGLVEREGLEPSTPAF